MVNFTHCLLVAATVAGLSGLEAYAADPSEIASATPKVISVAKTDMLASKPAKKSGRLMAAKKVKAKSHRSNTPALFAQGEDEVIYSCSFDFLTEGSETDPAELELDDWDNIPEEMIGEENYGFGGQGLMQAGGAVYIPFEYNADPDSNVPWYMEGLLWTPDIYEAMTVVIELDVKIAEGSESESEDLWVYANDYTNILDRNYEEIGTEWTNVSITIDCTEFVPESDDDSFYLTIFADKGSDILIKNVVIKGEKPALAIPVAEKYTDYTGTSFTAHWGEVENATGYYLTVYDYDVETNEPTTTFLDAQFTEETSYTVSGLTPGSFYTYEVTATNGTFTTAPSNSILVCELPSPTGLVITPSDDFKALNFAWEASAGANYYVLTATISREVTADEEVTLADADFSDIESSGTPAEPEESDYWYESLDELPGWQFNLGCSAEGAFGFFDNAYYTAMTGLYASLESMDYDLSNVKDGTVSVSVEAASPGNGMLAGLLSLNAEGTGYEVSSAYGTPDIVPEDYEIYNFNLTGATANSQFIFVTNSEDNSDGAILIRTLKITAIAESDGTVGLPLGAVETDETECTLNSELENGVTYTAYVTPYLVDDRGYILAVGNPSETSAYKAEISGIDAVTATGDEKAARFYNLQGHRINHPAKGAVVIKVTESGATKMVY